MAIFWHGVLRKLGYTLATFIIIVATLIIFARMLSPILNDHKNDFEQWASELLEIPIKIGAVHVSWYQYQPVITLNYVTLLNKKTKAPAMAIKKIQVLFSIQQSIWRRQFVPNGLVLIGTDVNIAQSASGEISVQGLPSFGKTDVSQQASTRFLDVLAWLSREPRIILQDVDIHYTALNQPVRFVTLYYLQFENSNVQHAILGQAVLHQAIPTALDVGLQWNGSMQDVPNIKAKLYLYISGFSVAQWLQGKIWHQWQINEGMLSSKIWANWDNGKFRKIQAIIHGYDIKLFSAVDHTTHEISRLSGNLGWKREGRNQIFAGNDILIDLPQHLWPVTNFFLSLAPDEAGNLKPTAAHLGYINGDDLLAFLKSTNGILSDPQKKFLQALHVHGDLENSDITFRAVDSDGWPSAFNASFSHLSFSPWQSYPGVQNATGTIECRGQQGSLTLNSHNTSFEYPLLFENKITFKQMDGHLQWFLDQNQQLVIKANKLSGFNSDAIIDHVEATLTLTRSGNPLIDLSAHFSMPDAKHVAQYLPLKIFDADLNHWLQQAFLSGGVEDGKIVVRGALNDFPFDKQNGEFLISGQFKNMAFQFAPAWPNLQNANGSLIFAGRKMDIKLDKADFAGITINHVEGSIPYIGKDQTQNVIIETNEISTSYAKAIDFIKHSPLKSTLGTILAHLSLEQPFKLKLALNIPINKPENTSILGDLTLLNNQLTVIPSNFTIEQLNGHLTFTQQTIDAKTITGKLFSKPTTLSLKTLNQAASIFEVTLVNDLDVKDLLGWLGLQTGTQLLGTTKVDTRITIQQNKPVEIHVQSDLLGLSINLPDQYAKKAQQPRFFSSDIFITEQDPLRLKIKYDDLLSAALLIKTENKKYKLLSCNISLGKDSPAWPNAPGLFITGNIDQLNWEKIVGYVSQTNNNHSWSQSLPLRGIDIRTQEISLFGQNLTSARVQITPSDANWKIYLTSAEAVGEIDVPKILSRDQLLDMNFQNLSLKSSLEQKEQPRFDVKSLPLISFQANHVNYDAMKLGKIIFKTATNSNGMTIPVFNVTDSTLDLRATGSWTQSGAANATRLQGSATSPNVSRFLSRLGFDVHNFVASDGRATFDLNWSDAPYSPTLSKMNGSLAIKLGRGRIVEVSQASSAKMDIGRMLNIFSLQSIPRRLSFDFSDVTQKGYIFDFVRGDISLKDGSAYTSNMRFEGPLASIQIAGRIGLVAKDYDLELSITPHVTASIPVAAALIWNPLVGLAAFGVNTVLNSGFSKVTTYSYQVKGPWSNPSWQARSR